jgi:transposase
MTMSDHRDDKKILDELQHLTHEIKRLEEKIEKLIHPPKPEHARIVTGAQVQVI